MGRLQQAILLLALDGKVQGSKAVVCPSDVKQSYYGFSACRRGRIVFRVADIGFKRYRAAGVSIVKAFQALERKGLVEKVHCQGVKLTGEGTRVARRLKKEGAHK